MRMHNPPHPGGLIYRTYIEPCEGVTAASVARALGVAKSTFKRLLDCKSSISPSMAIRLGKVLDCSPESWLLMQNHYDLWIASQSVNTKDLHKMEFKAKAA